jgi:ribosomal protein S7
MTLNQVVLVVVLVRAQMEQQQELNQHKLNLELLQDLFSMVMVAEKVQVAIKVVEVVVQVPLVLEM